LSVKINPRKVRFHVKGIHVLALGIIDVQRSLVEAQRNADPAEIVSFGNRAVPPGVTEADFKIDSAVRQRAIEGAAPTLNEFSA
jgi:hypothetical protein